jgi:hypothetical protein
LGWYSRTSGSIDIRKKRTNSTSSISFLIVNYVPKLHVGLVGFVTWERLHECSWIGLTERIPKPSGLAFPDIRFYRYPGKTDKLYYRGRSIDLFRILPKWSLDGVTHRGLVPASCLVQSPRSEHACAGCASDLRFSPACSNPRGLLSLVASTLPADPPLLVYHS